MVRLRRSFCREAAANLKVPNLAMEGERLAPWVASIPWGDLWADAGMPECMRYIRENHSLCLPPHIKALFPEEI